MCRGAIRCPANRPYLCNSFKCGTAPIKDQCCSALPSCPGLGGVATCPRYLSRAKSGRYVGMAGVSRGRVPTCKARSTTNVRPPQARIFIMLKF